LIDEARDNASILKTELERLPEVESAAISSVVPGRRVVYLTVRIPDLAGTKNNAETEPDGTTNMRVMSVDQDFVKTMGLQIIEGRDFAKANAADIDGAFLLNEAAVKAFGLNDPIGRPFEYVFQREPKKGKIIGVVKDFHFASVHNQVEPLMLHYDPPFFGTLSVRLKGGDIPAAVAQVEHVWNRTVDLPFSYQFLDTQYDSLYRSERATASVMTGLTALALIIACLGLFGIVSFFVVQRTREVGIRKVFGATPGSLFGVLSHEYVVMVILGNVLAFYPAWAMSQQWLQQFSYRASVSWIIFAVAFAASGVLAVLSIAYVIVRTSKANPAVILRSE
jgi:putative ABC transport system permease protein